MQSEGLKVRFCTPAPCGPGEPVRSLHGLLGVVLMCMGISACSPTYNWRALRDDAIPLQALMPCKPDSAQRDVPLGGRLRSLQMHSCMAGGLTFAIGWVELDEPAGLNEALMNWREATLATLQRDPSDILAPSATAWGVPGAEQVQTLEAQGTSPAGQPVQVRAVYFGQGVHIYQAAVYGTALPDEASASFFEALRLP